VRLGPEQSVVFVTGKGGVGKSSVAAALAVAEARRNGSAVLVEFEGSTAAARALADETEGVRTVIVEYIEALAETISKMLSSRLLAKLVVKQRALKKVVEAVPAIRELVALDRVRSLAAESPGTRIVVDLPATGHAVDWLRVPSAAERFLKVGPAAKMCRAILEEVLSKDKSALVVVSTAEPVVAMETRELCHRLQHELGRRPELMVVNRVPRRPSRQECEAARELARLDPAWLPLAQSLEHDTELQADARIALTALDGASNADVVEVPELFRDPKPSDLLAHLEAIR
jgi:MinD-like ATPase involved in chromosome partitioning or flagellar assembly